MVAAPAGHGGGSDGNGTAAAAAAAPDVGAVEGPEDPHWVARKLSHYVGRELSIGPDLAALRRQQERDGVKQAPGW